MVDSYFYWWEMTSYLYLTELIEKVRSVRYGHNLAIKLTNIINHRLYKKGETTVSKIETKTS